MRRKYGARRTPGGRSEVGICTGARVFREDRSIVSVDASLDDVGLCAQRTESFTGGLRVRELERGSAVRSGDTRCRSQLAGQLPAEGESVVDRQGDARDQSGDAAGHQYNSLKLLADGWVAPRGHFSSWRSRENRG